MGQNVLAVVKNSDLDAIAEDPEFGLRLADAVRMTSWHNSWKMIREFSSMRLSDFCRENGFEPPVYDIQASEPCHSSDYRAALVDRDGRLWCFDGAETPASPGPWRDFADAYSDLGYGIGHKDPAMLASLPQTSHQDEASYTESWSEACFAAGHTAFVIILDGLSMIKSDRELGLRFRDGVREYHQARRALQDIPRQYRGRIGMRRSISAGNHANPIENCGFIRGGSPAIIAYGKNFGRILQPHQEHEDILPGIETETRDRIMTEMHARIQGALGERGFSVSKNGQLLNKPRKDQRKLVEHVCEEADLDREDGPR